jgi:hypothetical protein
MSGFIICLEVLRYIHSGILGIDPDIESPFPENRDHSFIVGINRINHTPETSADKVDQYSTTYTVRIVCYACQGNSFGVEDRIEVVDVHDG